MAKEIQDSANVQAPRIPWAGKQVGIQQIEDQLAHFWRMSADNVRSSQNVNVRTSVLNLVICVPTIEAAQMASTLVRDLSSTHVARVLLLILDKNAPNMVATWATIRSFPVISDLTRHSFEQITMMLQGTAVYSLTNIVTPLLKPDLPVYLWWLQDPPDEQRLFESLASLSDRLIVDSASFTKPEESIRALSSLVRASTNSAISDLNWGRLTRWRELVAQFFDSSEYTPYLSGLNRIDIEHSMSPDTNTAPNATSALLLAAWLKTRLGWQVLSEEGSGAENTQHVGTHTWSLNRPTGTISGRSSGRRTGALPSLARGYIYIRPRVQPLIQSGSLCLVRLTSDLDEKRATFVIDREDDDPEHVITAVELPQKTRPQRTVTMAASRKSSDLLHDELEIVTRDTQYEQALQEVADMLATS